MKNIPDWLLYLGSAASAVYAIYRVIKLFSQMISKDQNQQRDIDKLKKGQSGTDERLTTLEKKELLTSKDIEGLKKDQEGLALEVKKLSSDHVNMDKLLVRIDSNLEEVKRSVETSKGR